MNRALTSRYRRHEVPLVVVAPSSTIDGSLATGAEIAIEERAPGELRMFTATAITPADADVFNLPST